MGCFLLVEYIQAKVKKYAQSKHAEVNLKVVL